MPAESVSSPAVQARRMRLSAAAYFAFVAIPATNAGSDGVLGEEGDNAGYSRNRAGNCFANAVMRVSAMT